MEFHEVLKLVGDNGRFQKLLVYVFSPLVMFYGSMSYWSQIFIHLEPEHKCRLPEFLPSGWYDMDNLTSACQINRFAMSHFYAAYDEHNATSLGILGTGCPFGMDYDYTDLYPTAASEFNWVCDERWRVSFSHWSYWIGSTLGFFMTGFLLDRIGRWKTTFIFNFMLGISKIATIYAPNYPMFCLSRAFSGMSSLPFLSSTYTLVIEMVSPGSRKLVGASTAIHWLLMAGIFPWIAYCVRDWRILLWISASPILLIGFLFKFVPESPSWLISRGDLEKAVLNLQYIAKLNGIPEENLASLKQLLTKGKVKDEEKREEYLRTTTLLIKTPNLRKKTLLLFLGWLAINMSYTGVNFTAPPSGFNLYLSYSLGSLLEIPILFAILLLIDRIGRRLPVVVSLLIVGILGPATAFLSKDCLWISSLVIVINRELCSMAYNVFFQLANELYPTPLRGRGVCLMRTLGDIGSSLAPYIIALESRNNIIPSLVFSAVALIGVLATLFLPETLKTPLPETIEEAEEFGKEQSVCFCPAFQCSSRGKDLE